MVFKILAASSVLLASCGKNGETSSLTADKVAGKAKTLYCKTEGEVGVTGKLTSRFIVRATLGAKANEYKNFYLVAVDLRSGKNKDKFGSSSKSAVKAERVDKKWSIDLPEKKGSSCTYNFSYDDLPGDGIVTSSCTEKGKEVSQKIYMKCSYLKEDGSETTESQLNTIVANSEVGNGGAGYEKVSKIKTAKDVEMFFEKRRDRKIDKEFTFCGRDVENKEDGGVELSVDKEDSFKKLANLSKDLNLETDTTLEGLRKLQKDKNLSVFGYLEGIDASRTCEIRQFIAITTDGYILDVEYDTGD